MKALIASDIHGSAFYARELVRAIEREQPDRICLLGDLLYHGPRNDLPREYAPKEVIALLNDYAERIIAVRGNCEAEVDQMVLSFPCMADYAQLFDGSTGVTLFLTHGHALDPDNPPALPPKTAFCFGHTHIKRLERAGDLVVCNPGSLSLPKDETHSFALYEDGLLAVRTIDGALWAQTDLA